MRQFLAPAGQPEMMRKNRLLFYRKTVSDQNNAVSFICFILEENDMKLYTKRWRR